MPDLSATLPSALRAAARWMRIGEREQIPAMIVHPAWDSAARPPAPVVIWMHGRTVNKELDPGRYLRWMRAGIAACAVDLPGHGERFDADLQRASNTLDVVKQMIDEIDEVVASLERLGRFDRSRMAIGGVSAGGMAALARLCRPHKFRCASVEAATGSWSHQNEREMFRDRPSDEIAPLDPARHLDGWREIPLQAIHAAHDEWVRIEGQQAFIDGLRARYRDPSLVEFIVYRERTGAPNEHQGFGRMAADAKDRQREFLRRWLAHPEVV